MAPRRGNPAADTDAITRILAILFLLAGIGGLIATAYLARTTAADATVALLRERTALGAEGNATALESVFRVVAASAFLLSATALAVARGLWLRRQWARRLGIAIAIPLLLWWVLGAAGAALSPHATLMPIIGNASGALLCAGALYALTHRRVQQRCA